MKTVEIPASPDVQLLGCEAVVLKGLAALDAYRLLSEGIDAVRRRDGIEPNSRLLTTLAALKVAAAAIPPAEAAEVRKFRRTSNPRALRSGRWVGTHEVADLLGVSDRQVRNLAARLGGHKGRNGAWRFDLALVKTYRESEQTA